METIQQQHIATLERNKSKERAKDIGEQQVKFNEALKKAMSEKDKEMNNLIKKNRKLQESLVGAGEVALLKTRNEKLELELSEMKHAMEASMIQSTIPISETSTGGPASQASVLKLREENQLLKEQLTKSMTHIVNSGKISVINLEVGDIVLVFYSEEHQQYMIYTESNKLYFLNTEEESASELGLAGINGGGKSEIQSKKRYLTAEIVDKDYCLARKQGNRFKVPQGTRFYRVKCKKVDKEAVWLSQHQQQQQQ